MLMFFFSSEHAEIERVRRELLEAGIPCEIHEASLLEGAPQVPFDEELWIHNDEDTHRALMLCVEQGLGFAKRNVPPDWTEMEPEEEDTDQQQP